MPVNPSERHVSLESRWIAEDLAATFEQLRHNMLHRSRLNDDKKPRRTPREGPPAREQEERK